MSSKKPSRRGQSVGAVLGITDNTLFDVMCSQYKAAGYEIETGGQQFDENDTRESYMFLECHDPKVKLKKKGDVRNTIIHYFNGDGTRITEAKLHRAVVKEVIIETDGKYLM